ncbi:hypothetical protein TPA0598_04_00600 [Streptomyces lydicamycinicus]|uniref:Uncharacterized protein n=1 Tax=Streptomyces lydicamycinicus TaxID=1546107 RepID=A0A0P4R693_9ACTN|nr:hypothetical protein [Streptomyces lydicamycinicus]GAO08424.1 hypothetical protein TPA0598_04_00600 [Streptomyces lydicamycinicus]
MDRRGRQVSGSKSNLRAAMRTVRNKRKRDGQSPDTATAGLRFDWQSLLGFGGALVGLFFVLLNAGYLHFYEELGVRPEEVGLDRVGVLARTAGIALAVFFAVFAVVAVTSSIPFVRTHRFLSLCIFGVVYYSIFIFAVVTRNFWVQGIVIPFLGLLFAFVFLMSHKRFSKMLILASVLVGAGALCLALRAERSAVDRRLEYAASGIPVKPVTLFNFPILDIYAEHAQVALMDKSERSPVELRDPNLLFLGKGSSVAAFIGCGNTVIMPADKVVVRMGDGINFRKSGKMRDDPRLRWEFCQCVHAHRNDC